MSRARCEPPEALRGRGGWHWIKRHGMFIARWQTFPTSKGLDAHWITDDHKTATPDWAAERWGWTYIAPVPDPADLAALVRDARAMAGRAEHDRWDLDASGPAQDLSAIKTTLAPFAHIPDAEPGA